MQQAVETVEMPIQAEAGGLEQEWRDFCKANCKIVFQTALLLTADATAAESAVTNSIDSLDVSSPPANGALADWEQAVVERSIETSPLPSPTSNSATRSLLQPGLLLVIQIERFSRVCFVLRMLLGYSTALCSQILGVEESHVRMFFQLAVLQLHQKAAANRIPP
jgi:hypothetical protein